MARGTSLVLGLSGLLSLALAFHPTGPVPGGVPATQSSEFSIPAGSAAADSSTHDPSPSTHLQGVQQQAPLTGARPLRWSRAALDVARDASPLKPPADRNLLSSIKSLYTSEPPDPNRRTMKLVRLGTWNGPKPKPKPKSAQEKRLDELVWGRWTLEEESIDRPSQADLKKYGAKLQPTWSKYREDLLFDMYGSLMITNEDTIGYGVGWAWSGMESMYDSPTLRFRINRKGVGIDFDEYSDITDMPSMSFYRGTFQDGDFNTVTGIIERNRDIVRPEGEKRIVVKVGTFVMRKVD